jgi:hypothetical protein
MTQSDAALVNQAAAAAMSCRYGFACGCQCGPLRSKAIKRRTLIYGASLESGTATISSGIKKGRFRGLFLQNPSQLISADEP